MRTIIGLVVSTLLFYLSNRMGFIIKLTGRGWRQPYRAYYKLVHASQRARVWAQSTRGNSEEGEQLKLGVASKQRAAFGPYHGRIIIPMEGRGMHLASSGRGVKLGSGSGGGQWHETAFRPEHLSSDTVKPIQPKQPKHWQDVRA